MNEQACRMREDQARGQYDLEHAFDGVYAWVVEVVLMMKGLGEDYIIIIQSNLLTVPKITGTSVTVPVS